MPFGEWGWQGGCVKSPKVSLPPMPAPPPPPVSSTGLDAQAAADDAKAAIASKYSWNKTILRPGGLSVTPPNTSRTLGA